jgi:hypothetical protein
MPTHIPGSWPLWIRRMRLRPVLRWLVPRDRCQVCGKRWPCPQAGWATPLGLS